MHEVFIFVLYCTVLYCTVLYCTVLLNNQCTVQQYSRVINASIHNMLFDLFHHVLWSVHDAGMVCRNM
jgi:hypothetical protein